VAFFVFTNRSVLKRVPLWIYAPIRAFAISSLFTPALLGGSIGAIPVPASFLAYLTLNEWLNGYSRTAGENLISVLPLWILITIVAYLYTLIRHKKSEVEPVDTDNPDNPPLNSKNQLDD